VAVLRLGRDTLSRSGPHLVHEREHGGLCSLGLRGMIGWNVLFLERGSSTV
jgi:hypothetical protein